MSDEASTKLGIGRAIDFIAKGLPGHPATTPAQPAGAAEPAIEKGFDPSNPADWPSQGQHATGLKLTSAGIRYIAADFACNADHPVHRENLKAVVRSALEKAADRIDELEKRLADLGVKA